MRLAHSKNHPNRVLVFTIAKFYTVENYPGTSKPVMRIYNLSLIIESVLISTMIIKLVRRISPNLTPVLLKYTR